MDPVSLIMIALIGVLIIFMFRNGKKRQRAMQQLQEGLRPGAGVMLQSGIFATVTEIGEDDNRVTIISGTSTLVVHRNAVSQIIDPVEEPAESEESVAPDDDPAFGEHVEGHSEAALSDSAENDENVEAADGGDSAAEDASGDNQDPKA